MKLLQGSLEPLLLKMQWHTHTMPTLTPIFELGQYERFIGT